MENKDIKEKGKNKQKSRKNKTNKNFKDINRER
jgi:hypothetical protein